MPLTLKRRPKSPYWIIRGTLRGIRIEESTGTSDKRAAEEIRAKREADLLDQSIYGRRATCTFAAAGLSYMDSGGNKRFLEPVLRYFGTTPLARIDLEAIERGARKTYPSASNATLDRQFYTPTSAVLKHAAKRGWCAPLILERPDVSAPPIRWLTLDEANRLIAACADHLRPLVIFMIYTGARIGEALWLDWRDLDLPAVTSSFPRPRTATPVVSRFMNALSSRLPICRIGRARFSAALVACPMSGLSAPMTRRQEAESRKLSPERVSALALPISHHTAAATHGRRGIMRQTATSAH